MLLGVQGGTLCLKYQLALVAVSLAFGVYALWSGHHAAKKSQHAQIDLRSARQAGVEHFVRGGHGRSRREEAEYQQHTHR